MNEEGNMKDKQLKVLILEDVESDAELVKLQFESMDFEPQFELTDKKDQYIELLDSFCPDLILSDFNLPMFDGIKALRILREKDFITPFIFVTGTLGEENAVRAIKEGATDFIAKERVDHLPAAILKAFREKEERTSRLQEEFKYKLLIENSAECIMVVNKDTSITYISPSVQKILGYEPGEVLSSSIMSYFPIEDVDLRMSKFGDVLEKKGVVQNDECRIRTKSGGFIWVSATLSNQLDVDGLNGVVINFRDINEKKLREKEIRSSEMRFRALAEEGSDLISILDASGVYQFCSENHRRIFGYSNQELIGKRLTDLVHPEDAYRIIKALDNTGKEKRVKANPFRFRNKDGKYHWVESIFTNMVKDETVNGIVINSRDVTSMVEKTKELELSNERYYYASKAAEDHIYEWNLETGEVIRLGDSLNTLFGYSNEEASKSGFWESKVHPFDKSEAYRKLNAHLKDPGNDKCEHEYRFLKADGKYAYVNDTGYILRNDQGKAIRLIGAVSDITKQKNLDIHNDLMQSITKALNKKASLNEGLSHIAQILLEFSSATVVEFWMTNIDNQELIRSGWASADKSGHMFIQKSIDFRFSISKGEGIPVKVLKNESFMNIFNPSESPHFYRKKFAKQYNLRSGLSIPISFDNEIIGVVLLLAKKEDVLVESQQVLENIAKEISPYIQRKKSEEQLNNFFELSHDVLCIAGLDGYFKKVNPAMCELLGFDEEYILSSPIVSLIHPEDIDQTTKELENLSKGRKTMQFENRYLTANAKVVWFSWVAICKEDEGLVYAVARDITATKDLEKLLEKSQKLAKIGAWSHDLQTNEIEWVPITREIYEVDHDFIPTSATVNQFYSNEDLKKLEQYYARTVNDGESWVDEFKLLTFKGNRRWVRISAEAEFIEGKCIRVYGSIQDIHEVKSAELEKINILESIADGFIGLNSIDIVTHWNYKAEEIFQVERSKALGTNLWDLLEQSDVQDAELLKKESYLALHQQEPREFELSIKGHWFDISLFPKRDGLTFYLRDVTDKRLTQQRLIKAITETQEKERARFGRELHDGITQYLAASKMNLSQFKSQLELGKTKFNVLNKVMNYLQEAIDESRTISHGLLSTTLQNQGLKIAISEIFKNIESSKQISMSLKYDLPEHTQFSKEIELNLFRIMQELTNNMVKYANATEARCCFQLVKDKIIVEMNDNGIGIEGLDDNNFKKGAGLSNIEIRVKSMNGQFKISNLHPGLCTQIVLPVTQKDNKMHTESELTI